MKCPRSIWIYHLGVLQISNEASTLLEFVGTETAILEALNSNFRQSRNPNTSNTGAMGGTPFEASNSTEALRQDFGLKKDHIDIIG